VNFSLLPEIDIVAGLGEIGKPILTLFSKNASVIGYDIDKKLMSMKEFQQYSDIDTRFLHICIPFGDKFKENMITLSQKFSQK
jgi:hypothetical protein